MAEADAGPVLVPTERDGIYSSTFRVPASAADISSYAFRHDMTVASFLCSVYALAVSEATGRKSPLVHLTVDGRNGISDRDSLGLYAKNIPVVLSDGDDRVSILEGTSEQILDSMEQDACPLWELQRDLGTVTEIRFQYAYYIKDYIGRSNFSRLDAIRETLDPFYDLYVMALEDDGGFLILSQLAPGYDPGTVENINGKMGEIVEDIFKKE
jgi:hypothetical protein